MTMQTCTMHILSLHGGGSILEVVRLEDVMIEKLFSNLSSTALCRAECLSSGRRLAYHEATL